MDKEKLKTLQKALGIHSLEMNIEDFEYVKLIEKQGIEITIYEDGLIVLNKNPESKLEKDIKALTSYYEEKLSPALSYIFSLGAPVPKELANIKTIYPYFVVLDNATKEDIEQLLKDFHQKKYFEIKADSFEIYRGDILYIINSLSEPFSNIGQFINEQIFIREFKGQVHRYLNLHRLIWEKIAEVKERGEIRGKDIGTFKNEIESYNKTINFIEARINQMGTYIHTRETIFKNKESLRHFANVLQFRYEALSDTLEYIKDLWTMTKNYVASAIKLFETLQAQSTNNSIQSLTVVTSMGVGASILSLFAQKPPTFTLFGMMYFLALAIIGYTTNRAMKSIAMKRMYKIRDVEIAKNIK
ncbi:MAG: hypothetical protein HZA35_02850 [Parcubacteria group bacterium]|nr:hypothetical protein [Parcubacteria group bacterium]